MVAVCLAGARRDAVGCLMKLEFTNNALARMLERGIREAEVRAALDTPDHLGPWLEKCWHAKKKLEARTIEVIFTRDLVQTQILTTYWQDLSS
jgi:hypothetical protein